MGVVVKRAMSISIDSELIEWINENSEDLFRNKSHLVEEAIKNLKNKNQNQNQNKEGGFE